MVTLIFLLGLTPSANKESIISTLLKLRDVYKVNLSRDIKEVYFICSGTSWMKIDEEISRFLQEQLSNLNLDKILNVIQLKSVDDLNEIYETISEALGNLKDDTYFVNITPGTKAMVSSVVEFFTRKKLELGKNIRVILQYVGGNVRGKDGKVIETKGTICYEREL